MRTLKLYLGVDGGQSGTTAVIGDASRVLGTGEAGPCNHAAAGEGRAKLERAVRESLAGACRQAGFDPEKTEFEGACLGMSGGPEDKREIIAGTIKTRHLSVTNDAVVALVGATGGEPGAVTIAGTGSISFGRNNLGVTARAGGWGYVFGDEGSAFDIARQALGAALRMEEGWGPPTALRDVLLAATGAGNANDALHLFYTPEWPRSRVAGLAPLVDKAAEAGDPIALDILTRAAHELATLQNAVRARIFTAEEPVISAYVGGVFHSRILLERFKTLVELSDRVRCEPAKFSPAIGALIEARRIAATGR